MLKPLTAVVVFLFSSTMAIAGDGRQDSPRQRRHAKLLASQNAGELDMAVTPQKTRTGRPTSLSIAETRARRRVGLQLAGGFPGIGLAASGLEATVFAGSDWQFAANYFQGSTFTSSQSSAGDAMVISSGSLQAKLATVGVRHFASNTFFFGSAIGLRSYDANLQVETLAREGINMTVHADALVSDFKIGNQWAFGSGFYLTAEWLGYQAVLRHKSSTAHQSTLGEDYDAAVRDVGDDLKDALDTRGGVHSVLAVGWAF